MGPRAGWIGLGLIGRPMALRLLEAGYELVVHNRSREVVRALVGRGASQAYSPREVAEQVDVLFTALPFPATVEEVYLGVDGIVEGAGKGLICVDHSTVRPSMSRRIANTLEARGCALLDAPISGGPEAAVAGSLAMMVGGPAEAYQRALPLLEVLGKRVVRCGPNGAGSSVKLVNQVLVTIHSVAAAEALAFAEHSGVDPELALDLAGAGLGASAMLSRNGPRMLSDDFAPGARIAMLLKDAGLIRERCDELGIELPVFFQSKQTFESAFELELGSSDLAAVLQAVRLSAVLDRRNREPEGAAVPEPAS